MKISRSAQVANCIAAFEKLMCLPPALEDGVMAVRIVGEFSAGKTRLIRELLESLVPAVLLPVSSLERQTLLPLEVTYGPSAELLVVERADDTDCASLVQTLSVFPCREDLPNEYSDPGRYRLRLTVPEHALILPEGDGYSEDSNPKRLFLIDTPGWNADEEGMDEDSLVNNIRLEGGWHAALVYVVNVNRLDSRYNRARFFEFIQMLLSGEIGSAGEKPTLMYVVTHCLPHEQARFRAQEEMRVREALGEHGYAEDMLDLHVQCVDFTAMDERAKGELRSAFWNCIRTAAGSSSTPPSFAQKIAGWPQEWRLGSRVMLTIDAIERLQNQLARFRPEGKYLAGMNMTRLIGLDSAARTARLRQAWYRQLGGPPEPIDAIPELPEEHPVAPWWREYWQCRLADLDRTYRDLVATMERALVELPESTAVLEEYLASRLDIAYTETLSMLDGSFAKLCQAITRMDSPREEQLVATLLSLSIIESRYTDYYNQARRQSLAG
jgi:hypothetical protein